MDIVYLIETFGFEVVMIIGLGYFVFFVWQTINKIINPALDSMKATIIRLTDQLRLLDQDMIRLQQKVNTVTELKEEGKLNEEAINTSTDKSNTTKSRSSTKIQKPFFQWTGYFCTLSYNRKSRKVKKRKNTR